ncbi:MAG: hypothetical protein R2838_24445 [Caldilineaceae bacterium]
MRHAAAKPGLHASSTKRATPTSRWRRPLSPAPSTRTFTPSATPSTRSSICSSTPPMTSACSTTPSTPISKRQMLHKSKSLSYFGVGTTYATSVAILQRVLANEVVRMRMQRHSSLTPEEVNGGLSESRRKAMYGRQRKVEPSDFCRGIHAELD